MVNQDELIQNRYRLIRLLGSGGFGAVYLAEDQRLGRTVAIKEMDAARLGPDERAVAEQLFEREARMLASLDHPNLTRIWDFFQQGRRAFLVMEYVPGRTLRDLAQTRGGPLDEPFVLECALQLCDVLAYLHSRQPQVIFRDLKPANVMVVEGLGTGGWGSGASSPNPQPPAPSPRAVLIDFGIARLFKPDQPGDTLIIGTPGYAPPEQYGQGQTDERSDIYSLGATLYHLLSGQVPNTVPPAPLTSVNPAISPDLARIVARATEVDPADRYQRIDDLRRDLLALARPQPTAIPAAAVRKSQSQAPYQPPPSRNRTTTQLPAPPALASPPRRSSAALLMIVVLALLGVVGLGGVALSTLGLPPGGVRRPAPTPAPQPTVAPAAQDWLLPGVPGRLAFGQSPDQTGYDLFVAALDGTLPQQITNDRASISPAWSPDGKRLAITRATGAGRGIFVADLETLAFEQVSPAEQEARYPAWSPDGQRIAFAMRAYTSASWQLAIVQLSSRAVTATGVGAVAWISWSRQGTLAYSALAADATQQDIFTLDTGGTPRNLTNSPDAEEDFPAWSPNGNRVAFVASPPGTDNLSQRQIFVMDADGGNRTQLTAGPGPHTNPVWSTDGQWLAYLSQEAGADWQVWAMRADGSEPRQVSFSPERKFYLAWGE